MDALKVHVKHPRESIDSFFGQFFRETQIEIGDCILYHTCISSTSGESPTQCVAGSRIIITALWWKCSLDRHTFFLTLRSTRNTEIFSDCLEHSTSHQVACVFCSEGYAPVHSSSGVQSQERLQQQSTLMWMQLGSVWKSARCRFWEILFLPLRKSSAAQTFLLLRTPVQFEHFIHLVCLLRQIGFLLSCKLVHTVLQVILNLASSGVLLLPLLFWCNCLPFQILAELIGCRSKFKSRGLGFGSF